ncbi:hypothetical protein Hanom_Chr08g00706171 [Helianthus anomalus]
MRRQNNIPTFAFTSNQISVYGEVPLLGDTIIDFSNSSVKKLNPCSSSSTRFIEV